MSVALSREAVEAVVARDVLPYVRNHGGDVRIGEIGDDGAVTVTLDGACRGCPAAAVTSVAVVERALRDALGENVRVEVPQLSVSRHAVDRIRRLFPSRVR